jgi:hypothetical protein
VAKNVRAWSLFRPRPARLAWRKKHLVTALGTGHAAT